VRSDTARSSSSSSPLACHGIDLPLCCLAMEEEEDDEDEGPAGRPAPWRARPGGSPTGFWHMIMCQGGCASPGPWKGGCPRVIIGGVSETFLFRAALFSVETKSTLQNPNPPTPPAHKG